MAGGFKVDVNEFARAATRLSELNDRTQSENLERYARTTLSNRKGTGLLEITPPAGNGVSGVAARQQGEGAIDRDVAAVFIPVRLKGKRKERWPEVEAIHAERFASKHGGKPMTRGRAQAYYVDAQKLRDVRRLLYGRVGALASGLVAACNRLGVLVPSWIARHGSRRGSVRVQLAGPKKVIEIVNDVPGDSPVGEVERRTQQAVDYATSRMQREIEHLLARDAQRAGFRAAL